MSTPFSHACNSGIARLTSAFRLFTSNQALRPGQTITEEIGVGNLLDTDGGYGFGDTGFFSMLVRNHRQTTWVDDGKLGIRIVEIRGFSWDRALPRVSH